LKRWKLHLSLAGLLIVAAVAVAFVLGAFSSAVARYVKVEVRAHGGTTVALQVPKAAVAAVTTIAPEQGMKAEPPIPLAAREQRAALAAIDELPPTAPDAAPFQRGCQTRIVQNYSSRAGVAPELEILHYTVSANRPGPSDVSAVDAWFDEAIAQASSNYIIDGEGNCDLSVPETAKAWAQAAYNRVAVSYEVVNTGHEPVYIAHAGLLKLAMVMSDSMCRWHLPIRLGAVSNGVVTRSGILDHNALGILGGGHHDITPYKVAPIIAAVKQARAKYGCVNGRPGKPKPTRAQRRKVLRGELLKLHAHGETWTQIKATTTYRQFLSLGGH